MQLAGAATAQEALLVQRLPMLSPLRVCRCLALRAPLTRDPPRLSLAPLCADLLSKNFTFGSKAELKTATPNGLNFTSEVSVVEKKSELERKEEMGDQGEETERERRACVPAPLPHSPLTSPFTPFPLCCSRCHHQGRLQERQLQGGQAGPQH